MQNPVDETFALLVLSAFSCLPAVMADEPAPEKLLPTTEDELTFALSYALRHDGRREFKHSGEIMAKLTASHLIEHLRKQGFVVMKKPPAEMAPSPLTWQNNKHLTE